MSQASKSDRTKPTHQEPQALDPIIVPFIRAENVDAAAQEMERLIDLCEHSVIKPIVQHRLYDCTRAQENLEVEHDAVLGLVKTLWGCKEDPEKNGIADLRAYAATDS